jgi:hypothetical protein
MAKFLFPPLDPLTTDQKFRYLSVYFRTDDGRAHTAFTFPIAKGADPIDTLNSYASSKACNGDSEYVDALQRYVKELDSEKIPLPPPIQTMKRSASEGGSEMSVPDTLVPGGKRDEEIELRLRQGLSFIDMETIFQRTAVFIAREAERIVGKSEVQKLLKQKKMGEWSRYETQQLMVLRERGLSLTKLATWLRRTTRSIQKQLQELQPTLVALDVIQGPQGLPSGLRESLFDTRLKAIWQALLASDMVQTWRETLLRSDIDWLSLISGSIPEHVKKALGGLGPPTWEKLESLPLIDTNDAGVYARLATSRHDFHMASDRYLYIGSATRYSGGLKRRIADHTRERKTKHEPRLQHDIRTKTLKDSFVTLMVVRMNHPDAEAVLEVRRTVILAEAILTVWLGALESPPHDLRSACPWDLETLQWTGWSSHNPLKDDVVLPGKHNIPKSGDFEC